MAKKAGVIWIDAQGERVLHVITTSSGVGSIETQLSALSNGAILECWEGLDEVYSVTPSTSQYNSVRNTAVLTFSDATGSTAKLYIPSPSSSIFLADGTTVDPSAITSLITAAIGSLIAGSGNPVTMFVSGEMIATKFSGIATVR